MLPRFILIADGFCDPDIAQHAIVAAQAGVGWVHLRDHQATEEVFLQQAKLLAPALREANAEMMISINSRLAVAKAIGAHYHAGQTDASAKEGWMDSYIKGYSAHSVEEGCQAVVHGVDYLFFSPVFPTRSKPGHAGAGLKSLGRFCDAVSVPVFALGGITPERTAACRAVGAYGVAVLSGILDAPHAGRAAEVYLAATRTPVSSKNQSRSTGFK